MNLSVKKKETFIFFGMVEALCDVPKFLQYILDYAVTKPIYHTKVMPIDLAASLKIK